MAEGSTNTTIIEEPKLDRKTGVLKMAMDLVKIHSNLAAFDKVTIFHDIANKVCAIFH